MSGFNGATSSAGDVAAQRSSGGALGGGIGRRPCKSSNGLLRGCKERMDVVTASDGAVVVMEEESYRRCLLLLTFLNSCSAANMPSSRPHEPRDSHVTLVTRDPLSQGRETRLSLTFTSHIVLAITFTTLKLSAA